MFAAELERQAREIPPGLFLARTPTLWFLCVTTCCIFLSWLRVRRHEVHPEILSDHAIRLHFKYRSIELFYSVRVSNRPLMEWHAFATIPDVDETGDISGCSFVVSNAGSWTNRMIVNPPKKLWIRGDPLYGLLVTARLFKRHVIVATDSGIGPFLSLLHTNLVPCRVLWCSQNRKMAYGAKIIDAVLNADPKAIIWSTRERGRPDIISLAYRSIQESEADAVFIISNPKAKRRVVHGKESFGIAAYGAIFDS